MAYVLPVFNLPCRIWRNTGMFPPGVPPVPPDVLCMGNLSPGRLVSDIGARPLGTSFGIQPMILRVPPLTDVRDTKGGPNGDLLEVPAGTGRMYLASSK